MTPLSALQVRSDLSAEPEVAYLSADEVARILGCTGRHVRRLVERGELPALRLAGNHAKIRIKSVDLAEFLQARTNHVETRG